MAVVGSGLSRHLKSHFGWQDDFGGWLRLLQRRGRTANLRTPCTVFANETKFVELSLAIWALRVVEVRHILTHHASSIGAWEGQVEWTCCSIFEFDKEAPPGAPGLHIVVPPCLHAWSVGLAVYSQSGCVTYRTKTARQNCMKTRISFRSEHPSPHLLLHSCFGAL